MHTVTVQKTIGVSDVEAWKVLDDFGGVEKYHPLVERSPLKGEQRSGEGAMRTCHFHGGGSIEEKITGYEEGVGYEVTVTDPGPMPLESAVADLRVTPAGAERSTIRLAMHFKPKYGPIGWLMAKTVMKSQLRKTMGNLIDGLEEHAMTGAIVGPNRSGPDGTSEVVETTA